MAEFWVLSSSITIDSSNNTFVVREDGTTNYTCTIASGTYYLFEGSATASSDSNSLLQAILSAIVDSGSGMTPTATFTAKTTSGGVGGVVTITTDTTSIQLIASGSTFDFTTIGFAQADSAVGSPTLTSTLTPTLTWTADQPQVNIDPVRYEQVATRNVSPSGSSSVFVASDELLSYDVAFELVSRDRTWKRGASSDTARTFESWWAIANDGRRIRLYEGTDTSGSIEALTDAANLVGTFVMRDPMLKTFEPAIDLEGTLTYGWTVPLAPYVA